MQSPPYSIPHPGPKSIFFIECRIATVKFKVTAGPKKLLQSEACIFIQAYGRSYAAKIWPIIAHFKA